MGDSIIATMDTYDQMIYAVGKGPTQTRVTASPAVLSLNNGVMIQGYVTDISAGTKDDKIALRFPNGVPAVADESMSDWMLYVYKQFSRPMNAKGVKVTLSVLDANNNYREIGKTTANSDGFFTFNWKPDIEGQYTVYASFAGSESYWPSHAVTSFAVDPAPAPAQTPAYPTPVDNTGLLYGILGGVIAAIVIGLAAVFLSIRKK